MKRVLTALVLVPVAVYSVLFAPWAIFLAVIFLFAGCCFHEYATITKSFAPLGYAAGAMILLAPPSDVGIIVFISLFTYFIPIGLWITAYFAGVKVSIFKDLVGMRLRKVPPQAIVRPKISATKALPGESRNATNTGSAPAT